MMAWIACLPASAAAQTVEIAPVGGYRFGGGFFERVTEQQVDLDGAPAVGLVVNVPLRDGLFVEALVTHQRASVTVPAGASGSRLAGVSTSITSRPADCRSSVTAVARGRS